MRDWIHKRHPTPSLSQWSSSGNPVCPELRPQCALECHRRKNVGSQCAFCGLPVVFQWLSSGLSMCSNYAHWHWIATGTPLGASISQCSSSGIPVYLWLQWSSSMLQINTGLPLEHHWVLASASVVPVASQCTCGSSGLPVWSVQWYPRVLTESGLEVIRSGHFPAYDPLCIQLVWWELFELNWFHLTCNPKYTKTIVVFISKACTE